jgi:SAM-dependent methyltransferase
MTQPSAACSAHASEDVPTGNTYDKYSSKNPVERRLMAGFFAALDTLVPSAAPASILEVGVGEGEVSSRLADRWPEARMVGLDLPDPDLAVHWPGAPFCGAFADIANLPFPARSFDLVLAIEVLEHVPDPVAALAEIARVARADIVVSVPREPIWRAANLARGKYLGAVGNTPGHINHWSRRSFTSFVSQQLDVQQSRSPFPWTMVAASVRP